MRYRILALAVLLVLAGCSGTGADTTTDGDGTGPTADTTTTATAEETDPDRPGTTRTDPDSDRLGWEDGYWYDDPLRIDRSDGYNGTELDRLTARTMARVERIRKLEFEDGVSVEWIAREEYEARFLETGSGKPTVYGELRHEALFLVGENRSVPEVQASGGMALVGRHLGDGKIIMVRDAAEVVRVDALLAHELVHALQDQEGYFETLYEGRARTDGFAGSFAVLEGDATYVQRIYERRCRSEWSCDSPPARQNESNTPLADDPRAVTGLTVTGAMRYDVGERFVETVQSRGGWAAVEDLDRSPPASSAQVIHPDRHGTAGPASVALPDRSGPGWRRSTYVNAETGTDTVGEGRLYAMLAANGLVPEGRPLEANYSLPATDGWAGDSLAVYINNSEPAISVGAAGDGYAYVFRIRWESAADARQFLAAYRQVLDRHGARGVDGREGVYRIETGTFADAFRVTRDDDTVTIVNAPTVGTLDEIHDDGDDGGGDDDGG